MLIGSIIIVVVVLFIYIDRKFVVIMKFKINFLGFVFINKIMFKVMRVCKFYFCMFRVKINLFIKRKMIGDV